MEDANHTAVARTVEIGTHDDRYMPVWESRTLVLHYDGQGAIVAIHTPLEDPDGENPVRCTWCETPGNRVRIAP